MTSSSLVKFRYGVLFFGCILSAATALMGEADSTELIWFSIRLAIWAIVPYVLFFLISSKVKYSAAVVGAGVAIIGVDVLFHLSILFFPGSSTDAIALLFIPVLLIILIMPVGFALGVGAEKIIASIKRRAGRSN